MNKKQLDNNTNNHSAKTVTPEMEAFAMEYGLFIVTIGQKYINALSCEFTTENIMDIFKERYWGTDWL